MSPVMEMAGQRVPTMAISEDTTLTAGDSGKVIFLDGSSAGVEVTLPAAASGLTFTFFLVVAGNDIDIIQSAAAEDFVGSITAHNGIKTADTGDTLVRFDTSATPLPGDWVKLTCYNDDDWYVMGNSNTTAAVVFV
tara:strand:- start:3643 stop:4050 length:408 start_codon:yes stop_codon:yes gene_type:complete